MFTSPELYACPGDTYPEELSEHKMISRIPEMMEFGASNSDVLSMIRSGIHRSAAIELSQYIPSTSRGNPIEWLRKNRVDELSPLHKRYLRNQGFWE